MNLNKTDRSWLPRTLRGLVAAGLVLSLTSRAAGQEHETPGAAPAADTSALQAASSAEPTRKIRIESLRVEGVRRESVGRIVLSESRLVAGEEYTEREIAQAARRVKRLPFVVDARPFLRRASAPGCYTLVLAIEEHSPLTLGVTGDHWGAGQERTSIAKISPTLERFLGPLTQLHLSVDAGATRARWLEWWSPTLQSDDAPLAANLLFGVTRYDIAGPASRLDVALSAGREICRARGFLTEPCDVETGWRLDGTLLIPFARDDSLTLFAGFQAERATKRVGMIVDEGGATVRFVDPREEYEVGTQRVRFGFIWARDTTDDPLAALEGTQIVAGLSVWLNDEDYSDYPYQERPLLDGLDFGVPVLRFQHLFPLSRGFTLSAVAVPLGSLGPGAKQHFYVGGTSLGLRWVHAGRRNRYRLSLESGIIGAAESSADSRHWRFYSSLRFRSGHIVIALNGQWAR